MSGVCVKHDRYVQPGEVCPYCEPAPSPAMAAVEAALAEGWAALGRSTAFEVPFAVSDRTKLSLDFLIIEPGDTLNGRRVRSVDEEADGVMVHLEPAAEPAPRSGPPVVISYVSVEATKDEHDAYLASRYPSFHLTIDNPTTPEQQERLERFKRAWAEACPSAWRPKEPIE